MPRPEVNPNFDTDVSFQGAPKWYGQYLEGILREARALSLREYQPYSQSPEYNRQRIADLEKMDMPSGATIPISVTGKSKPVMFTPYEIYEAVNNKSYAKEIFSETTGISNFSDKDVEDFRNRLKADYQGSIKKVEAAQEDIKHLEGKNLENAIKKNLAEGLSLPEKQSQFNPNQQRAREEALKKTNFLNNKIAQLSSLKEKNLIDKVNASNDVDTLTKSVNGTSQKAKTRDLPLLELAKKKFLDAEKEINQAEKDLKLNKDELNLLNSHDHDKDFINLSGDVSEAKLPASILKRAAVQREIEKIVSQSGSARIAPMNETHNQARRMLERGFDDDSLTQAKKEIDETRRKNIHDEIEPFIDLVGQGPHLYMDLYRDRYKKNVIDAYREEAQDDYERDLQKANLSFAQHGAFHTGARNQYIQEMHADKTKRVEREIARLLSHGEDKAMQHSAEYHKNMLGAAEIKGNALRSQNENYRANAEALRANAVSNNAIGHANAGALGQFAKSEQEQEQNELNVKLQDRLENEEHGWKQLQRESAIARGHPMPATQNYSAQMLGQPTAPNVYNAMGGGLGALYGLNKQQGPGGFAKGGPVRRNYAKGGAVSRWNELGQQVQPGPHDQDLRDIASEMRHYRVDPTANWMTHVGNAMLSNVRGDPMQNLGRGSTSANEAMERAHERMLTSREKAANLYQKINESRLNQHQVLATYENQRETLGQRQKEFEGTLGETQRHNMATEEYQRGLLEKEKEKKSRPNNPITGQPFVSEYEEKEFFKNKYANPENKVNAKKEVNEALLGIRKSLSAKKQTEHLSKLLAKANTGPWIGAIKSHLPATKIDNRIRVAADNIIMDLHQGMKNIPRSEEFIKRLEATKPTIKNSAEANQDSLSLMNSKADDAYEHNVGVLMSHGWTMEQIQEAMGSKGALKPPASQQMPTEGGAEQMSPQQLAQTELRRRGVIA